MARLTKEQREEIANRRVAAQVALGAYAKHIRRAYPNDPGTSETEDTAIDLIADILHFHPKKNAARIIRCAVAHCEAELKGE